MSSHNIWFCGAIRNILFSVEKVIHLELHQVENKILIRYIVTLKTS